MAFLPIAMYFLTVKTIFGGKTTILHEIWKTSSSEIDSGPGNATYSGITAAVTANVVLFAYIYVAWKEDQGDRQEAEKSQSKKAQ